MRYSASLLYGYWRSWLRRKRSVVATLFGMFIGLLMALCLKVDFDNGTTTFPASLDDISHQSSDFLVLPQNESAEAGSLHKVWLRCVVTVQPNTKRIHKFVQAVEDTYAKRCNETLVFTNSPALQKKFEESSTLRTFLVETSLGPANWPYFYRILHFVAEEDAKTKAQNQTRWTAVVNEQSYLVVENIRRLLSTLNPVSEAVLLGRVVNIKSWVSKFLFPYFSAESDTFVSEALLLFSPEALGRIANSSDCAPSASSDFGWFHWLFMPKYTGKALLKCARANEKIRVLDPVDEEGYRLIVATNLRILLSKLTTSNRQKNPESWFSFFENKIHPIGHNSSQQFRVAAGCCSHRAIAFATLNYRDQRVVDFATTQLKVFGL